PGRQCPAADASAEGDGPSPGALARPHDLPDRDEPRAPPPRGELARRPDAVVAGDAPAKPAGDGVPRGGRLEEPEADRRPPLPPPAPAHREGGRRDRKASDG